jgi:hypothetical protein
MHLGWYKEIKSAVEEVFRDRKKRNVERLMRSDENDLL